MQAAGVKNGRIIKICGSFLSTACRFWALMRMLLSLALHHQNLDEKQNEGQQFDEQNTPFCGAHKKACSVDLYIKFVDVSCSLVLFVLVRPIKTGLSNPAPGVRWGCPSRPGLNLGSVQPLPQLILGPLRDSTCLVKCLRGLLILVLSNYQTIKCVLAHSCI